MLRGILTLAFVIAGWLHAMAADRSAVPIQAAAPAQSLPFKDGSFALVIGIDDYGNGWPHLNNAIKDAEAVGKALEGQGFAVTLKTNLRSADLKQAIEDFIYERGQDADSRLVIWYAGHGHTIDGEAYLVPADAPAPNPDREFRRRALSMRDFGKYMREARSRHVLAIFDSCFSGSVFEITRSREESPAILQATNLPVREMISSGAAEQTVSDDGMFRRLFIDALDGQEPLADANRDGYITGSELGLFLTDKITSLTQNRQTPQFGKLRELGFDRGDFVFKVETDGQAGEVKSANLQPSDGSRAVGKDVDEAAAPPPEQPPGQEPASSGQFDMAAGQTLLMMDNRLTFSMDGTPYGGRGDLVGMVVNGQIAALYAGAFVTADASDGSCILTLMQILPDRQARFLKQCGPNGTGDRAASAALAVSLSGRPSQLQRFSADGGTTRIIQPGPVVLSMMRTPYGGRSDLVGVTIDGDEQPMWLGQQRDVPVDGVQCSLTPISIDSKKNRAEFLWRCADTAGTVEAAGQATEEGEAPGSAKSDAALKQFAVAGGTTQLLDPGPVVLTVSRMPYGGRSDLVGVVVNGEDEPMALGQRREVVAADKNCILTATAINSKKNQAEFLWQCR